MLIIHPLPALQDNYIWCLTQAGQKQCVVVDPGEAKPVIDYLEKNQLQLTTILLTHHHWDHTQGVPELLKKYQPAVFASHRASLPFHFTPVRENEEINILFSRHPEYREESREILRRDPHKDDARYVQGDSLYFKILEISGHTLDHIAYYVHDALFCGDTLFAAGCGRAFEGTPAQLYTALQKLALLPDGTRIYCGHEYTQKNLKFALQLEPLNQKVKQRLVEVTALRQNREATLPSRLALEKYTNPFLRSEDPALIEALLMAGYGPFNTPLEVFTLLRQLKDQF